MTWASASSNWAMSLCISLGLQPGPARSMRLQQSPSATAPIMRQEDERR